MPSIPATAQIRAVVGRSGSRPLLVAVGTRDGEGTGAAWISVSGEEWSRPIRLDGSRFATDVVVAGSKFVVVGSVGAAAGSNGIVLAAYFPSAGRTWRSTNGRRWTVVDPPQSAPHADIRRVTSGPDGLLALGGMDGGGQVTWRSRNGARWARPAELSSDVDLYDVVSVGPPSKYLAVGASWGDACPDTDGAMPAAWGSADGSTWTRLTGDDVGCGSFLSVVAGPAGFVAAGSYVKAGTYVSAAWHSADGRSWQGPSDFNGGWVETLAVIDDVYVAVGDGIWESTDGREWQRVVDTQGVVLAAVGGGVAIGVDADGGIAWIAEPSR